jgi:PAS domain S-box-containing protein
MYRQLVENMKDVIFATNEHGVIIYISPTIETLIGIPVAQVVGHPFTHFIHGDDLPTIEQEFGEALSGQIETSEFRIITASGAPRWVRATARRLVLNDKVVGIQGVIGDISEAKESAVVRQRLEAQLRQAQKMEAVGTLAGGIAHDFNNLLQAVHGYAELLLLDKKERDPGSEELQGILRAAKRGAELTQQLLTFSRKTGSELSQLDLNSEVLKTIKLLERTIPKMIEIEFLRAGNLKLVYADSAQIEQILLNLAVNAKDAMPDGGKLILSTGNALLDDRFCRTHAGAKPGEYVSLTITDTGCGMDHATLEHIFEPFFTTKGLAAGTGLGLAMVYGIVKSHGGYIECTSKPARGTSFKIFLPIAGATPEPELDKPPTPATPIGGTETILLVDDEDFVRDLGEQMLTKFGYRVLTSPDGEAALKLYRARADDIDLILLDLIMPGMGGRKCLERLRELGSKTPVLIASGYPSDRSTRETIKAGAVGFVAKPFNLQRLLEAVRSALNRPA